MNKRLFSIALLVSALPLFSLAESSGIFFNEGDFISAKKIERNGEAIVSVKLSKSGKAKIKKLNETSMGKEVHTEIADVAKTFTLKVPLTGDGLEVGPYSKGNAKKVIKKINSQ